uniref:PRMT5 TIM barrel domain-containing protein n=1 Tax=Callorhinchus milii TaxID=7868 RepID=A0A4W3GFI4_CALMI
PWIQADAEDERVRRNSEAALIQELDFAAYLGVPAFLIPIRQHDNPNLARVLLNHLLTGHHSTMFWIRVPIMSWEDTRDDMIENEPLKRTEDLSCSVARVVRCAVYGAPFTSGGRPKALDSWVG